MPLQAKFDVSCTCPNAKCGQCNEMRALRNDKRLEPVMYLAEPDLSVGSASRDAYLASAKSCEPAARPGAREGSRPPLVSPTVFPSVLALP